MSTIELDTAGYEELHLREGFELAASSEVFVPLFRCTLKCACEEQMAMTEIDKLVCACVERGICLEEEICFVLSLDHEIVGGEIERLTDGSILSLEDERLKLTVYGWDCYSRKTRAAKSERDFEVLMNAITGEWMMSDDEDEDRIIRLENGVISLPPLRTAIAMDIENNDNIRAELGKKNETQITRMRLMERKTVEYHKEYALFFQDAQDRMLFEVVDPKKEELDLHLSAALRNRYEKREILELVRAEKHLKSAPKALVQDIRKEHPDACLSKKEDLKYLANREIREMLLNQLDRASGNLFIISPWINGFVMNENMLTRFENALKRGVKIEIGYGYISIDKMRKRLKKYEEDEKRAANDIEKNMLIDKRKNDKDVSSKIMADNLKNRFSEYKDFSIRYIKSGSHEKFFCYDDSHVYIGSMNLLSYDGGADKNYQGFNFRSEGGILLVNEQFAKERMDDFRSRMEDF